jgi:hypothetical protein
MLTLMSSNKKTNRPVARRPSRRPGLLAVALVVVLLAVLVIVRLSTRTSATASPSLVGRPVPASLVGTLVSASRADYDVTSGATAPSILKPQNPIWRQGGRPVVFYAGGDYCPYCAAERWVLIMAMARFGRFTHLRYMRSSTSDPAYPGTATFSFYGSRYTSPYVTFLPVEMYRDKEVNGTYPPLQSLTPRETAVFDRYDAPPYVEAPGGQIPFVDVGNRYFWIGASYDPGLLSGLGWSAIAHRLTGSGSLATAVAANVNALTAAVCAVDGGRPSTVCTEPGVSTFLRALPR